MKVCFTCLHCDTVFERIPLDSLAATAELPYKETTFLIYCILSYNVSQSNCINCEQPLLSFE